MDSQWTKNTTQFHNYNSTFPSKLWRYHRDKNALNHNGSMDNMRNKKNQEGSHSTVSTTQDRHRFPVQCQLRIDSGSQPVLTTQFRLGLSAGAHYSGQTQPVPTTQDRLSRCPLLRTDSAGAHYSGQTQPVPTTQDRLRLTVQYLLLRIDSRPQHSAHY
jgi:hypothetical protein